MRGTADTLRTDELAKRRGLRGVARVGVLYPSIARVRHYRPQNQKSRDTRNPERGLWIFRKAMEVIRDIMLM